jgi:hypothetical protein
MALSNERPLDVKDGQVTFQWKDYRVKGRQKSKVMTLESPCCGKREMVRILTLAPAGAVAGFLMKMSCLRGLTTVLPPGSGSQSLVHADSPANAPPFRFSLLHHGLSRRAAWLLTA